MLPKRTLLVLGATTVAAFACVHQYNDGGELLHRCSANEASRRQLLLDANTSIYVEPQALAASSDRVLLAGTPNYTWTTSGVGGETESVEQNTVLGVILSGGGYARKLVAPVDANRVRTVRAVTQADGRWAIMFVEMSPLASTDSVARVWFGIHDGIDWLRLAQIPLPKDGILRTGAVSRLTRGGGDTLAFAVPVRLATYDDLAVFTYDGSTWSYEIIPTRKVAYADLSYSAVTGWLMAVVQPDSTVPRDLNSLFLYAKAGGWTVLRKIDSGRTAPIHHPSLRLGSNKGASTLGWLAVVTSPNGGQRSEARVAPDPLGDAVLIARIDSTAEAAVPVVLTNGMVVWVTDHQGAGDKSIRLFQPTGADQRMTEIGRVSNQFEGQFGAVALPAGGILISGPLMQVSGETLTSLSSQLVHVDIRCTPGR